MIPVSELEVGQKKRELRRLPSGRSRADSGAAGWCGAAEARQTKRPAKLTEAILRAIRRPELPFTASYIMEGFKHRRFKVSPKSLQTRLNAMVKAGILKVVRPGRGGRQAHRFTSYKLVKGGAK